MTPSRVLAIGAHPDDVEYFAGATVAAFAAEGATVGLVICTDGARGGPEGGALLAERRRAEAERAAASLGLQPPIFLGHPDGGLVVDERLRRDLVREIRRARPELVLVHDPTTLWTPVGPIFQMGHSDHRAAGQATLDAIYPRLFLASFYPELVAEGLRPWFVRELWLFDTSQADHCVPVLPGREAKRRALGCHQSQHVPGLVSGADALEASFAKQAGSDAEGFRRLRLA
jgi:LmbE family N-acetylglucosaminyl deacetylase